MRINDPELFAPVARVAFQGLEAALRRETRFRLFESFRSPERQAELVKLGRSKAAPFLSPHQLGLAADFVPRDSRGNWVWPDAKDPEWDILRRMASSFGLRNTIAWDRPHVEHPAYYRILPMMKRAPADADWRPPVQD